MTSRSLDIAHLPHRRKNILTGEWVLVSPNRSNRPWHGEREETPVEQPRPYDPDCYLCPGNRRANGETNPLYEETYVFTNDYPAILPDPASDKLNVSDLLVAQGETGICRVMNFSPRHDLTLAEMQEPAVERIVHAWQDEYRSLIANRKIKYVQIFENKGLMMGTSNPHPHCQIWAQQTVPMEPAKEQRQMLRYFSRHKSSILGDYLRLELRKTERLVYANKSFVAVVPFWAVWPFEMLVISRRRLSNILEFTMSEARDFANMMRVVTSKYDNLFTTSFPYSSGLHQAPTDGKRHTEWHFHMHFYPPLLRSAQVRKFMVGYEMLAEPQRDLTPEASARILRDLPEAHYRTTR